MSKIQIPVYVELANIPPGSYELKSELPWYRRFLSNEKLGWLHVSVDNKDGDISVLWLTNRNSHLSLTNNPALAITLRADGKLLSYYESALSMWLKWGYGIGSDLDLIRAIRFSDWAQCKLVNKHYGFYSVGNNILTVGQL